MDQKVIGDSQTVFSLFFELVARACQHHQVSDIVVEEYLARVLDRFVRNENASILNEPLLFAYRDRANHTTDASPIREVGDAALWVASMMRSCNKRILGVESYVDVGKQAYRLAFVRSEENSIFRPVYQRFFQDLWPYVRILREVRQESIFQSSESDIIEVWKRFEATGKEEDARWLREHGVTLFPKRTPKFIVKKKKTGFIM